MKEIFQARPFKVRNADEYNLENVLNLFVNPIDGLTSPFDYENSIVKGRMGSGKTMYLRANHAYYLYGVVPCLLEHSGEIILPILIRLSDFQHLTDPSIIYRAIIIRIVEEITSTYLHLSDQKKLAELHTGIRCLPDNLMGTHKLSQSIKKLSMLGSEEYIERITNELGLNASAKPKFMELSSKWKETKFCEVKTKPNPGIRDIEECYRSLLEDQDGKILLLIDEAGSLDKKFFQQESGSTFFEILMNQFRTASFIRTKIAVYPNSYSDMLTETRYGDIVHLLEDVTDERGYQKYRNRALELIDNYLNPESYNPTTCYPGDVFELSDSMYGDCLEQILYASGGNMRRLIHLLDVSMNVTYRESQGKSKVSNDFVIEALKEHAASIESLFTPQEKHFLDNVSSVCRARAAYKFKFPNMSPVLYKYTSKSQEYNIVNIDELGSGRRGTVYSFDYCYAILKDIPTHYLSTSGRINRDRTLQDGKWIGRVAQISDELLEQASLPGKIEGVIDYIHDNVGFIKCDQGDQYFYDTSQVIESDKNKRLFIGKRVRFYPTKINDTKIASNLEILE
jgi:hypothetical protein